VAVAEVRQLKAAQLLLEEDARKNKPLRDAVVRELQVRLEAEARVEQGGCPSVLGGEPWRMKSAGWVELWLPRGMFQRTRGRVAHAHA
jgi:hypothetical protein